MSAASPARGPEKGPPIPPRLNGYSQSPDVNKMSQSRGSWSGSRPTPRFIHIKDLQARAAAELRLTVHSSVDALLERAGQCTKQCNTDVDFKRPDRAYIEWLNGSEILLNILPRHRDYPYMSKTRKDLHAHLCQNNNRQHTLLKRIHDDIVEDNERSGIRPVSRPISNGPSTDILAQRFAQLRSPSNSSKPPLPYPDDELPVPHPTRSSQAYPESRPSGPRSIPPPPPKLPLPQPPAPAYSPARNLQYPSSVIPPRTSARSMVGPGGRTYVPSPKTTYPSETNGNPNQLSADEKRRLADLPNATAISVNELSARFRSHNILLIDVRSREDFDEGHIFAKAVMCIEPLSLKYGRPAEELEESLVVSPEAEQALFSRRNEYDLVVYYDQKTSTNRFLEGPPNGTFAPSLRALHDTLYEFEYYKPLQRPPAVLLGGLDAWVDLVGQNALQSSRTATMITSALPRRHSRLPAASANSSHEIRMRRLRDYNPLNADEDRAWREKAKKEEVTAAYMEQTQSGSDNDLLASVQEEPPSPLIHSYEDFLRKFPEPSLIQQSMVGSRYGAPMRPAPIIPSTPSRPVAAVSRPSYSGVSERQSSLEAPTSQQATSAQPPLYTSRFVAQYPKLPRTGLVNFGVTCYMNATIQCLLATIPLSQFFLDNRWREYLQKNWKGSGGIMPEMYANLIRSLWRNDVSAVRPTSLRKFCTRLNAEWGKDIQQDAKEFFDFLVNILHEDLNVHWQRTPLRPMTSVEEFNRERMAVNKVSQAEWERYSHRESSYLSSLFAGQHASRLRCKTCGNTSTTYEAFYSISIEIPRTGSGDIRNCLRSYCQEEMLSGDEEWRCPYCKCQREATKCITLTRLPQVLVIHFKRFSASKTETARKVHTPIDFPLHGLSMEPYMANTRLDPPPGHGVPDTAVTPPFQYDAYAVMRHLGQTGNGGHYISLVKDAARGCWCKFDDERATDFDPNKLSSAQRLQNEQAYIVFYGRSAAR